MPHRKQDRKSQNHDCQDSIDQKGAGVLFFWHDCVKRSARQQDGVSACACNTGVNMLYTAARLSSPDLRAAWQHGARRRN